MTTSLGHFPSKYRPGFFFFVFFTLSLLSPFEDNSALRWGSSNFRQTDLRDYASYYCACHLFSLALGMFAMVTVHSRPPGLTHAVLCIIPARLWWRELSARPSPNPWWGGLLDYSSGSRLGLMSHDYSAPWPQRASLPVRGGYFLSAATPDLPQPPTLSCHSFPSKDKERWRRKPQKIAKLFSLRMSATIKLVLSTRHSNKPDILVREEEMSVKISTWAAIYTFL